MPNSMWQWGNAMYADTRQAPEAINSKIKGPTPATVQHQEMYMDTT